MTRPYIPASLRRVPQRHRRLPLAIALALYVAAPALAVLLMLDRIIAGLVTCSIVGGC